MHVEKRSGARSSLQNEDHPKVSISPEIKRDATGKVQRHRVVVVVDVIPVGKDYRLDVVTEGQPAALIKPQHPILGGAAIPKFNR